MNTTYIHLRQCFYDKDKQPSLFVSSLFGSRFSVLWNFSSDIIINNTNNNNRLDKQIQYCQSYS